MQYPNLLRIRGTYTDPPVRVREGWNYTVNPSQAERVENAMYDDAEKTLLKRLDNLVEEAKAVAQLHWDYHLEENAGREPSEKGRLNVYVRKNKESVEIYWSKFRFVKPADGSRTRIRSSYLKRGRGHWYPDSVLARAGKTWEVEKAAGIEEQLGGIRAEIYSLKKALRSIRDAKKRQVERSSVAANEEYAV